MKKIIVSIIVIGLLLSTAPLSMGGNEAVDDFYVVCSETYDTMTEEEILSEIEETSDKSLEVEEVIGERYVKYWEHEIDGVQIKNDYILLHRDIYTNNIVEYIRDWREIDAESFNFEYTYFEPENIFWEEKVIFLDESDKTYFYSFDDAQEYPIACWEVRHTDGQTILYDFDGDQIGYGIPAPSKGFSLSGWDSIWWPDPWIDFRKSADYWFSKWCTSTVSISWPTPIVISSYVQDQDFEYFFELAHGDEWHFQADDDGSYYYASNLSGYNVQEDMTNRQPMRFAFIGSCHGMTTTGPGTFSYEFRKGQMTNTVTVGYDHMEDCYGWDFALPWQNYMFRKMNQGYTMKKSFDLATAIFPLIAPAVRFVGDTNLKYVNSQSESSQSTTTITAMGVPIAFTATTTSTGTTISTTTTTATSQTGTSTTAETGQSNTNR